jgi:thiol-disulfide isomerase/thioredoxin
MWSIGVWNVVRILAAAALACLTGVSTAAQNGIADAAQLDPIVGSRGKPAVLIFLRTDCPISQRYAPTIQALAAKYAGRATFWLVFPARNDSVEIIAAHTREYGYTLAAIRDPDQRLVRRAKATITPEAAVFDAQGVLRYHGRLDDLYISFGRARRAPTTHDLDDALSAVLAGKAVTHDAEPAVGCYIADLK